MRIHLTARHCELDPEDRLFVEQRLEKLSRFARDATEAHVIVSAEKYRHSAEIIVRLKRQELKSREEGNGARVALEQAADRLEQQIRRLKDRRMERRRGDRTRTVDGVAPPAEGSPEEVDESMDGGSTEE